jgi:hypothetical protein
MTPTTPTPPTRPRLPTAAEADEMCGRAFLEAMELREEERRKKEATAKSENLTVLDTGKIDGGAYRWVELADGSSRVEEWRGDKWVPGGASFGEIANAPPVSPGFAAELGIPIADLGSSRTGILCGDKKGRSMLIYRGELVSGPAALPRLLLRDLIHEKVFLGPVSVNDGTVARLINEPNGGLRMETWVTGVGWIEAPKGSLSLANFMPGAMRPVSADLAARVGMPATKIARHWINDALDENREKVIHALKERAWDLAASSVRPGRG